MKYRKSIKVNLLSVFGAILVLSLLLPVWGLYKVNKIMNYQSVRETFYHINNLVSQLGKTEKDFLIGESKHPKFMQTGESKYLTESAEIIVRIRNKMKDLRAHKTAFGLNTDKNLNEITTSLTGYSQKLNQLAENIRNRRFYNLPTEEEPIAASHHVEQSGFSYNRSLMLLLSIYKKDLDRKSVV